MQLARFLYDVLFDYRVFLWHCTITISGIPEKVRFVCLAWLFDESPAASVLDAIYNLGRNFAGFVNVETILNRNNRYVFCIYVVNLDAYRRDPDKEMNWLLDNCSFVPSFPYIFFFSGFTEVFLEVLDRLQGFLYDFVQFQCIIYDQCFKNDIVRLPGFIYDLVRLPGYIYDLVRLQGFIYELSFFAEIFNWNCTITGIHIWHFVLLPRYSMNLYDYRASYITFCFITENFKWPCMITGIPLWPFAFLPRF